MKSKRSRVPYRINPRRNMPRHILIKLTKIKNKERILKAAREKQQVRRPPVKVGGPCSYGWKDLPNKILIPLQSLISRFLEPPWTGGQKWVQFRDSGEATLWYVPKALSAGPQELLPKPVGVLLSLLFSVPRIRPMKTVSTGQVFSRFSGRLWRGFFGTFFRLLFPPVLQLAPGTQAWPKLMKLRLWCLIAKIHWETKR